MRIQLNQYMRDLPECFEDNNSISCKRISCYCGFCKGCRTEFFFKWVHPRIRKREIRGREFQTLMTRHKYKGKSYDIDYVDINDPNKCSSIIKFSTTLGIPETEVKEQIEKLRAIQAEEKLAREEWEKNRPFKDYECPICHEKIDFFGFSIMLGEHEGLLARNGVLTKAEIAEFKACNPHMVDSQQCLRCKTMDEMFDILTFPLKSKEEIHFTNQYNMLVSPFDMIVEQPTENKNIKSSSENLKSYIHHLFMVETNIYAASKRLRELYVLQKERDADVFRNECIIANDIRKQGTEYQSQYENAEKELKRIQSVGVEPVHVAKPQEPRKPSQPMLEKPGLFNKKKVLAQNEQLTAQYQSACQQYELDMQTYHHALEECNATEARMKQEAEERYHKALEAAQQEVEKAKTLMEQGAADVDEQIKRACELPCAETIAKKMVDDEVAQAESMLKGLLECRNKLYAYDVVFSKYRNLVALATFYEYLTTGRCVALEGADGAYNLFEAECRANQIIGQLSTIIDSLEKIKENQYLIYSQLKAIDSNISRMNSTLQDMSSSLKDIKADTHNISGYMETVAKNSDVIAHNTAVNAYYSKMNAELTNSLGYLAALH